MSIIKDNNYRDYYFHFIDQAIEWHVLAHESYEESPMQVSDYYEYMYRVGMAEGYEMSAYTIAMNDNILKTERGNDMALTPDVRWYHYLIGEIIAWYCPLKANEYMKKVYDTVPMRIVND